LDAVIKADNTHKGGNKMEYVYKSADDLPPFLNALQISAFLGISKTNIYALMNSAGFPTVRVGKRMIVEKEKLLKWLDENAAK
jgi:predicted DNA-binding transcriptional regulator AlpA